MPTQTNPKLKKQPPSQKTQKAVTGVVLPPIACTKEEYEDLKSTASSLTEEEAKSELIECARYGELDAVRALIEIWSTPNTKKDTNMDTSADTKQSNYIDSTDANGNTALHKAGSNGHTDIVSLLLHHKASYTTNKSLNTPLHWAASNGHEKIVEIIINHDFGFELDVLVKNEFGRSILTEGFGSKNTKLVGLLLEHDSASEDKLLDGGEEINPNDVDMKDGNDSNNIVDGDLKLTPDGNLTNGTGGGDGQGSVTSSTNGNSGIIHEFDFLRDGNEKEELNNNMAIDDTDTNNIMSPVEGQESEETKTLLIRELPIKNADTPFGETAIDDTTGLGIWSASLVMSRWMTSKSILGRFDNQTVLELGAGCGVPGLTVGLYSNAKSVYVTDFNPSTVRNLQYNIEINANRPSTKSSTGAEWLERVSASSIDWDDESTWPDNKMDYIIGSDLIYQQSIVPLLKKVVAGLLKPDGRFLYTCPSDGRDGLVEFIDTMKKQGFRCTSEEVAPDLYRSNPLSSGDEEDAFLHFYELPVTEYKLYEFRLV